MPNQIVNADELVLLWKLLLDHTLISIRIVHVNKSSAAEQQSSQERAIFLVCANGDGTYKLTLIVIG